MALNLGELNAIIDADDRGFTRAIDRSEKAMAGFQRDANGRLRDMRGHFVKEGEAMGRALGEGIQKYAAEGVDGIYRDAQGKLRTAQGRFIKEGTLLGEGFGQGLAQGSKQGLSAFDRNLDAVRGRLDGVNKRIGGTRALLSALGKVTAIAGIATAAAGAASALGPVVSLAGTLLTTAGGLAATLPAALLAGAAAAATLTIGLTGVGEAIAGDEEALQRLPGPAREFVSAVRDLKPAWDDVTKSVQSRLFEGVAKTFKSTAETILPRLKSGLGSVADGWNDVFRAGLKAATGTRFMAGLDAVLTSTGRALTSMASGLDGWLRGIGILASATAPLLEDMGEAAGSLGDRFGAWMEEARASGQLQSTLQTMRDTLSTIGGIVGNLGGIFGSVFGAANEQGGGLLGVIEDLTGRIDEFLSSTEGESALASFFSSLSEVGAAVAPIVLALAGAVAELAPKIAEIATEVGPTFAELIGEIGDAIGEIDAENLADGLGQVLDAVIPLIGPLGAFLGHVSSIDGIVPVAAIAVGVFTVAVWALNAALYANPIVWIIALVVALIAVIVLLILNWDTIVANMKAGWLLLVEAFEDGKTATSLIWQQITDWIATKVDQVQSAIAVLGTIPGNIADWFGRARDSAVDKLSSLVDWVKGVPGRISDALGDLGSLLFDQGKQIVQSLIDGVKAMWSDVESTFADLTSKIPDWKGPAEKDKKLLRGPVNLIMGGMIADLESWYPAVERSLAAFTEGLGLGVDTAAAPAASPAPTVVVNAPGPDEFTATAVLDLGEGIERVVDIKLQRRDRDLQRNILAGSGAAL